MKCAWCGMVGDEPHYDTDDCQRDALNVARLASKAWKARAKFWRYHCLKGHGPQQVRGEARAEGKKRRAGAQMNLDTIYTGDNVAVLATFPDACIDLTVTSPPYDDMDLDFNPIAKGGLRTYNGYSWDFKGLAAQLYRVTKPGGVVVWVVNDPTINGSESLASSLQKIYFRRVGWNIHDTMIWNKGGFTATGDLQYRYAPVFEYMLILSKGLPKTFNPIKDRKTKNGGATYSGTVRNPDGTMKSMSKSALVNSLSQRYSIWDMPPQGGEDTDHPAPFPEALARDHILSWSNPGDVVLDPFAGSGTTLKMAKQLDRRYIGIELSSEYVEKIIKPRLAGANVPLAGFAEMLSGRK